ncbi:MAG: SpoIIE family protein phosphatase [Mogibacterium sp.]|nr:SpoIIE family protein phosphatase [Mogibacterium sp.]
MGKDKTKRKSLGRKTLAGIIAFALLLTITVSLPVSYGFSVFSKRHYYEDTQDYANIINAVIQGDKIAGYLETGEKDGYYDNIDEFLASFRDEVDLTDISVFVPDGDEMIYIWDTDGADDDADLGDRTDVFLSYMDYVTEKINSKSTGSSGDALDDAMLVVTRTVDNTYISAFAPLYDSRGDLAAFICVTRPELKIGSVVSQFILAIFLASAIVSAIMMLFAYRAMKKRFLAPIAKLTKSAEEMVDNIERDREVAVDVHTNDELETLAEAFTKMDVDIRDYIDELAAVTAERERIGGELDAAAMIQQGILPKRGMQYEILPEFDLAASMTPAREVGGDFYDIFMADDRHLALVIGDVSGKGVPASLFMVATKILLKYAIKQGMSPSEAFEDTNEKLIESNDMELFVTAWLALIDLDTGECTVVNAGHEHPAIRQKGGIYEFVRYKHSPALATLEGMKFNEREYKLEPGDTLLVYTDGVIEATNWDKKLFGEDRLLIALNKNREATPDELIKIVKEDIAEFVEDGPQFDDITMLAFRFNGKQDK